VYGGGGAAPEWSPEHRWEATNTAAGVDDGGDDSGEFVTFQQLRVGEEGKVVTRKLAMGIDLSGEEHNGGGERRRRQLQRRGRKKRRRGIC